MVECILAAELEAVQLLISFAPHRVGNKSLVRCRPHSLTLRHSRAASAVYALKRRVQAMAAAGQQPHPGIATVLLDSGLAVDAVDTVS